MIAFALLSGQLADLPSGGVPVFGPNPTPRLELLGQTERGTLSRVPVTGQPFKEALRLETKVRPTNQWEFQVGAWTQQPVKRGDNVLIRVYFRTIKGQPETGEGRSLIGFATNGPEWARSASHGITFGREWKRFDLPFTIQHDRPAGQSLLAFDLGFNPQIIELGGLEVLNFGPSVPLDRLPKTRTSYAGEEPNAPWRIAARRRIDQIRRGPLTVRVINAKGQPVRNAVVRMEMTRHAFPFGTAIASDTLLAAGPDADKYRAILRQHFNQAAIENHLKWPFWETWGREDGLRSLRWLKEHNFRVRAHNVLWAGWDNLPPDLRARQSDRPFLRQRVDDRVKDVVTATKGLVDDWDVVNETFAQRDLLDILGWDLVAHVFRETHRLDPRPNLTLNDYPPLDGAATQNPHLNHFYEMVARLKREGAPIGSIGFQGHFGSEVVPPARVLAGLDRFAKLGLPIAITEFDMETPDRDLQARYMRDFMTAAFSHPSVLMITQWGFWEGKHWMPNAALWNRDWTIRPHGQVYLDLIHKEWKTDVTRRSDQAGRSVVRGFLGDYRVTVTSADGKIRREGKARLGTRTGASITIRM